MITLTRNLKSQWGIFGELSSERQTYGATLEHAYCLSGDYVPKVPVGQYTCVRGKHRLETMLKDFDAFELQKVPGHTNILIHKGNYNNDSSGCILLGESRSVLSTGQIMIIHSAQAFEQFMNQMKDQDQFLLIILERY